MEYRVQVEITLKPTVMDAAGTVINKAVHKLGHTQVTGVHIGKFIVLDIETETSEQAIQIAENTAKELLANPIIEQYACKLC